MQMDGLLRQAGIVFSVVRNEKELFSTIGLDNRETSTGKRYVGFMPGIDVQSGDILINPVQEKFFVTETRTAFFAGKAHRLMAYYQTEVERDAVLSEGRHSVFNIQNAYGSVIGNNYQTTINYKSALGELKERVSDEKSEDKADMEKVIALLEMVVNNQIPASKGLFSKFSELMERHSWLSGSVASTILGWLMSKIP